MKIKLVFDEKIPFVDEIFPEKDFYTLALSAKNITSKNIQQHDILLTRSVTKINAAIVANSNIKMVCSACSGHEHINNHDMRELGIAWSVAAGCNAESVADYVQACLELLIQDQKLAKSGLTIGIIGYGHVGKAVHKRLKHYSEIVLISDPAINHNSLQFADYAKLDLLCIHPSLSKQTPYPSYHLVDKNIIHRLKNNCVLINASRGAVVKSEDLLQYGQHLICCLDVFEGEPNINPALVESAYLATPHIAGHAIEAKFRAVSMVYRAICKQFGLLPQAPQLPAMLQSKQPDSKDVLACYNPLDDANAWQQLRDSMPIATSFKQIRDNYRVRQEYRTI